MQKENKIQVMSKPTVICNSWFCKQVNGILRLHNRYQSKPLWVSYPSRCSWPWYDHMNHMKISCVTLNPTPKKHTEITNYNCDNNTKLLFGSHNYKSVFRKYVLPSILDKPVLSRYSVIVDVYITVFGSQLLSRGLLWNQITKTHIWSPGKLIIPIKASWSRNQRRCEIYGQRNVLSLWQFL
jgi:hypothetical protein